MEGVPMEGVRRTPMAMPPTALDRIPRAVRPWSPRAVPRRRASLQLWPSSEAASQARAGGPVSGTLLIESRRDAPVSDPLPFEGSLSIVDLLSIADSFSEGSSAEYEEFVKASAALGSVETASARFQSDGAGGVSVDLDSGMSRFLLESLEHYSGRSSGIRLARDRAAGASSRGRSDLSRVFPLHRWGGLDSTQHGS